MGKVDRKVGLNFNEMLLEGKLMIWTVKINGPDKSYGCRVDN